jgi:hypothetical protein
MGAVLLAVPRRPTPTVRRNPLKGKRLDERVVNPAARVSRRAATPVRAAPRVDPRRHRADPAGLAAALAGLDERLRRASSRGGHRGAPAGPGWSRIALPRAAAAVAALVALERGGIGLVGPSREVGRALLPEVRRSLPTWEGLVERGGVWGGPR